MRYRNSVTSYGRTQFNSHMNMAEKITAASNEAAVVFYLKIDMIIPIVFMNMADIFSMNVSAVLISGSNCILPSDVSGAKRILSMLMSAAFSLAKAKRISSTLLSLPQGMPAPPSLPKR